MKVYVLLFDQDTQHYYEWEETRAPHPRIAGATVAQSIRVTGRRWRTMKEAQVANSHATKAAHLARLSAED